jgi:hypothetical protein
MEAEQLGIVFPFGATPYSFWLYYNKMTWLIILSKYLLVKINV